MWRQTRVTQSHCTYSVEAASHALERQNLVSLTFTRVTVHSWKKAGIKYHDGFFFSPLAVGKNILT